MGVFDKLKNALFEVEYVEEEIPEKKEKKKKEKNVDLTEDKPIAKKIVLPGKKEEKVEEIQEEDLMDEDFEIRPREQMVSEKPNDTFKFMDDDDFKIDEDPVIVESIPQPTIVSTYTPPPQPAAVAPQPSSTYERPNIPQASVFDNNYVREYDSYREKVKDEDYVIKPKESKPYGMDPSYQISIKKYGSYENRDEKTYFKPSPIISPIYGILDKNYKKEDVVPKKTVRISSYSRNNVNVDDVRNKAFAEKGSSVGAPPEVSEENTFDVDENENLMVDLSNEREKPEVKEITVGDAMEYFDDLGLEYNVDYVDVSNKKKKPGDLSDDIKMEMSPQIEPDDLTPKMIEEDKPTIPVLDKSPVVEVKDESNNAIEDDDDNLFDLIDSMYKEN